MTTVAARAVRVVPSESADRTAPRRIVVVGNPNVGKTTLFNALTRGNARIGNYGGITIEQRVGKLVTPGGVEPGIDVIDVPGAYSLSARSAEEQIAIAAILGLGDAPKPDLCLVVVDAGQLVRNLYLVLQIVELCVPTVICLNMIDEVAENPPRPEAVSALFGVPCVATSARAKVGIDRLVSVLREAVRAPAGGSVEVKYPGTLRRDVDRIAVELPAEWRSSVERDRALARWALTSLDDDDELVDIEPTLRAAVSEVRAAAGPRDLDQEIIVARYAFLDAAAPSLLTHAGPVRSSHTMSERIDRVLIHPIFGFGIFVVAMTIVFQSLFTWADPAIRAIERLVSFLQAQGIAHFSPGFLRDLVVQGVLGGVGNVIVFVPQIALLFFFIGILEDSGYMARVAYLMDRVMQALGLHGRAFVPMLSGFACAIPAILSTRTMERRRDRLLTMLVVPLMTCSARLPVYTLIIASLFPPTHVFGFVPVQGLLMIGMYLFAVAVALVAAFVLGRTAVRGRKIPLILELPPYRLPRLDATVRVIAERTRSFLVDAGTMILACTIVLWVLLSYPKAHDVDASTAPAVAAQQEIRQSYAGQIGRAIEPAIRPLGFDWKIGVGLVGAFAAREVFVSTMGLVYGVGRDEADAPLRDRMRAETRADGKPAYTPLAGLSLMVFFAIACQCMSTLATVRRETGSYKWPAFLFVYTGILAWTASFVVYQGGRLLFGM